MHLCRVENAQLSDRLTALALQYMDQGSAAGDAGLCSAILRYSVRGPDENFEKLVNKLLEIGSFEGGAAPRITVAVVSALVLKEYYELPLLAHLLTVIHRTPARDLHQQEGARAFFNTLLNACKDIVEANADREIASKRIAQTILESQKDREKALVEAVQARDLAVSNAHKLVYYLLTSPELGYTDVEIEKRYELGSTDLYIHDIGLAIELDGPSHFFNGSLRPLPTIQRRRLSRYMDTLNLPHLMWDELLDPRRRSFGDW